METLTYMDGKWTEGSPAVISPNSQSFWLGSAAFDGARYFDGVCPDLNRHCQRAVDSARVLGMTPPLTGPEIAELAWEGIAQFPKDTDLYIRPLFYAEDGFIVPEPSSARFVLSLHAYALPRDPKGFTACSSTYRRPARDMAPTDAKASCLYPNVARTLREAKERGYDTGVVRDPNGNVAEFAYQNLFFVRDEVVYTPAPNGSFLNGITRQRVIQLLSKKGVEVVEGCYSFKRLLEADEVFGTGNYAKLEPCVKVEDKEFPIGPFYKLARAAYFDWAKTS